MSEGTGQGHQDGGKVPGKQLALVSRTPERPGIGKPKGPHPDSQADHSTEMQLLGLSTCHPLHPSTVLWASTETLLPSLETLASDDNFCSLAIPIKLCV